MKCKDCGAYVQLGDSYCRGCGVRLDPSRMPVVLAPPQSLTRRRPAGPVLWRGVTVVAGTLVVELLRRILSDPGRWIGLTLDLLERRARNGGPGRSIAKKSDTSLDTARHHGRVQSPDVEVTETILLIERTIRRR